MSILYFSAINAMNGKIVVADESEKGHEYKCISCNDDMILKKSGNTGPGSKRPHFAHKARTEDNKCCPETVLHKTFKELLYEKIEKHIEEKTPIMFNWRCHNCGAKEERNMLKVANGVSMERRIYANSESLLEGWRTPDISLYVEDRPLFVIEIIVTHDIEKNAMEFYRDQGIMILRIYLDKMDDIYRVDDIVKNEIFIDKCPRNDGCEICGACNIFYVRTEAISCLCTYCLEPMMIPYTVINKKKTEYVKDMRLMISKENTDQQEEMGKFGCNLIFQRYQEKHETMKYRAINKCNNCNSVYSKMKEITKNRSDDAGGVNTRYIANLPKTIGRERKLCWKCMGYDMY